MKTYVVLFSNHTDHRDDDSVRVKANSREEAIEKAKYDKTRFSIKAVLTLAEAKKRWA